MFDRGAQHVARDLALLEALAMGIPVVASDVDGLGEVLGEAGRTVPPADPDALDDAEWADYLFNRTNPKGAHRELWNHAQGCRRWFGVERDTVTYQVHGSYRLSGGPGSQET